MSTHMQPVAPPPDLIGFKHAAALFAETGRPASASTLRRWARQSDLELWPDPADPSGRTQAVSYTDLLELHRDHQPSPN